MHRYVRLLIVLAVVGGLAWAAAVPGYSYWRKRNQTTFRTEEVMKRTVTFVVNSTGEVKPVLAVSVGSFVSGPIEQLEVDFNDRVSEGQLLAKIDPRIYDAAVARDRATLATREAEVERVRAELQQAINDERRSIALRAESEDFISLSEMDRFHFARRALEAQLRVGVAAVEQAEANLSNSVANLGYTEIRSPVDGIVIDRKIDPGQTLAAQFQTPELFIVAPEMEKKMHIYASVDEADIGLIRSAQEAGQPVQFTVDAYPDDLFEGIIEQIRFSSTAVENVVTYPVIVAAPNPNLKLLPGMTADLSFQIDEKQDVVCVPNAALRFFPSELQVREEDRKLLDGAASDEDDDENVQSPSAKQKYEAGLEENRHHVWVQEGELLRAIEVFTGISDNRYTEIISGDVEDGLELVTGVESK